MSQRPINLIKQRPAGRLLFILLLLGAVSTACQPSTLLVDAGLITPTPTPDPFRHFRAALQPWAQSDIEAAHPLPNYHITARLNDAGTAMEGVMQVDIPSPKSELVFRLYPNLKNYRGSITVSQALINGTPVEIEPLAENTAIRLGLPPVEENAPSEAVTVQLAFKTRLGENPETKGNYTLFGWDGSVLSLPGFYPLLAVEAAGQWVLDQPPSHGDVLFSEVVLYQLDITLPKEMSVASSGVVLNVIDNSDGSRTWQITGGPLRDMTVIAGPFQTVSQPAAGATVTSYYLPGHQAAALAALAHASAALRLYSDTYGTYPYTELDVVQAPLNLRGMEYSGLVLIGEDLYEDQRDFLTYLVAHEVGHQWWYAVVGNDPYRHPWLDEGLTEYGAFDYYRGVFGQSQAEDLLIGRWQMPFATAAAGGVDGAVDRPAADFDSASYELLVYGKAALFFNALREQLGEETYNRVLQTYFAENRYRIATPQTFIATAERVSGQNLNPLAEKWLK